MHMIYHSLALLASLILVFCIVNVYFSLQIRLRSKSDFWGMNEQHSSTLPYHAYLTHQSDYHNANVLQAPPIAKRMKKIAIFEEHEEALHYWYHANKEGLTAEHAFLIHVDGHSDMAPPQFTHGQLPFTKPKTYNELKTYIGRNDVFVLQGVSMSLVSSFEWLFPLWMEHVGANPPFYNFTGTLGRTTWLGRPYICFCNASEHCFVIHGDRRALLGSVIPIPHKMCDKQSPTLQLKFTSNSNFTGLPHIPKKISSNYILDIDEDYFGVQLPGQKLFDANISQHAYNNLTLIIITLFCPFERAHELLIDNFFTYIAHTTQTLCKSPATCLAARKKNEETYLAFRKTHGKVFCNRPFPPRDDLFSLLHFRQVHGVLESFNSVQLQAVIDIGFCFQSSLMRYSTQPSFRATRVVPCRGLNVKSGKLPEKLLRDSEFISEMRQLKRTLSKLPEPNFISICRSTRDGYTPRQQQQRIEKGILSIIFALYPSFSSGDVHYDENLLAGKLGWGHHKNEQHKLLGHGSFRML